MFFNGMKKLSRKLAHTSVPFVETELLPRDGKEVEMTFNEGYFSIRDKIKDIMANEQGKQVMDMFIAKMMEQMSGSGMDIPKGAMKMLGSFSIERIAKLAGDKIPAEGIVEINKVLQQIKK